MKRFILEILIMAVGYGLMCLCWGVNPAKVPLLQFLAGCFCMGACHGIIKAIDRK